MFSFIYLKKVCFTGRMVVLGRREVCLPCTWLVIEVHAEVMTRLDMLYGAFQIQTPLKCHGLLQITQKCIWIPKRTSLAALQQNKWKYKKLQPFLDTHHPPLFTSLQFQRNLNNFLPSWFLWRSRNAKYEENLKTFLRISHHHIQVLAWKYLDEMMIKILTVKAESIRRSRGWWRKHKNNSKLIRSKWNFNYQLYEVKLSGWKKGKCVLA